MADTPAESVGIRCEHGRPDHVRCSECTGDPITTSVPAEKQPKRRAEPLRDEHRDGETLWTIEAHDDQPIAEGKQYAADLRVLVLLNGERVREFTYPAYRIWTLLAHWTEGIADLQASLTEGGSDA